jgi:hypothetical protein
MRTEISHKTHSVTYQIGLCRQTFPVLTNTYVIRKSFLFQNFGKLCIPEVFWTVEPSSLSLVHDSYSVLDKEQT